MPGLINGIATSRESKKRLVQGQNWFFQEAQQENSIRSRAEVMEANQ